MTELPTSSPPRAVYSWNDIDRMTRRIAQQLELQRFAPDVIIGILRGGCIPAVHLSHLLRVRTFGVVQFQTTTSDEVGATRIEATPLPSPPLVNLKGLNVLLVDDVINTGATMRAACQILRAQNPVQLRSVALVWDMLAPDGSQLEVADCDLWIESVAAWVVFPWNH